MQKNFVSTLRFIATCALSLATTAVLAHDGHGLQGSHWHATDAGTYVLLGALVALAVWLTRNDK